MNTLGDKFNLKTWFPFFLFCLMVLVLINIVKGLLSPVALLCNIRLCAIFQDLCMSCSLLLIL